MKHCRLLLNTGRRIRNSLLPYQNCLGVDSIIDIRLFVSLWGKIRYTASGEQKDFSFGLLCGNEFCGEEVDGAAKYHESGHNT
jgi:hypothetical protein